MVAGGGKLHGSDSLPGLLKMDEGARVVTAENQRLTGHTGALLCLALLDSRLLFSSSTDLTIKARLNVPLGLFVVVKHLRALIHAGQQRYISCSSQQIC